MDLIRKDFGRGLEQIMSKRIVKLIGYTFQHHYQLLDAYDDSNSIRHLSKDFQMILIGKFNTVEPAFFGDEKKATIFLPARWNTDQIINFIKDLSPDIIHMHGNHNWKEYPVCAKAFKNNLKAKLIFSPAGPSCGTEEFLSYFDTIIVNHSLQVKRMKCPSYKVVIRKRSADPEIFYPINNSKKKFDFVYVAGFVPGKRIDLMIDYVIHTPYNMVVLGDFARTANHYREIRLTIKNRGLEDQIFLHDFIEQTKISKFLSKCKIWVWPGGIKPENPETLTNRSVIEALACGMPILAGMRAFNNSEFLVDGFNGFRYETKNEFITYSNILIDAFGVFGENSKELNDMEFDFQENFVDFYNNLYGS